MVDMLVMINTKPEVWGEEPESTPSHDNTCTTSRLSVTVSSGVLMPVFNYLQVHTLYNKLYVLTYCMNHHSNKHIHSLRERTLQKVVCKIAH